MSKCKWCGKQFDGYGLCSRKCSSELDREEKEKRRIRNERARAAKEAEQRRWNSLTTEEKRAELAANEAELAAKEVLRKEAEAKFQREAEKLKRKIQRNIQWFCKIFIFHIYWPVYFIWFLRNRGNKKVKGNVITDYLFIPVDDIEES